MTIKVPVRPIPALQCTSTGPIPGVTVLVTLGGAPAAVCLAFTSWRKFKTQPGSEGTP